MCWVSYTTGLWAWCLLTGRNVGFPQLLSFTQWPPTSAGSTAASPAPGSTGAPATTGTGAGGGRYYTNT